MVGHSVPAVRTPATERGDSAVGRSDGILRVLLGMQLLFYGLGYWGYYLSARQIKNKILFIPYYFLFMNINVLKGIRYLKKKKGNGAWEKAKRSEK
ncbi:hypothetical protein BFINE_40490 [Bacteroides finegoldii DSM 17565]|nr:hypothetical protein BFINE_40490 [Bacteroides finegoldii DSM 17565]